VSPWFIFLALVIVLAAAFLYLRYSRHTTPKSAETMTCWRLILPRGAAFPVSQASAWFSSLALLLKPQGPFPSVEIRGEGREVVYALSFPASWEATVRGQLTAWFPASRLEAETELPGEELIALALTGEKPDLYPLRIPDPHSPDPLVGVLGVLTQDDQRAGVRLTWGPAPAEWAHWAPAALEAARVGRKLPPRDWRLAVLSLVRFFRTATHITGEAKPALTRDPRLEGAAAKVRGPVFSARVVVWSASGIARARELAHSLQVGFRDPFGNALSVPPEKPRSNRQLTGTVPPRNLTLSAGELASLFHVPAEEHPLVPTEASRRVPPPVSLLSENLADEREVTLLGEALTTELPVPFGLGLAERRLHTYVVGKTGTGKSTLLATMLRQDLEVGRGVALIDPHGDLAELALSLVPPERYDEVLYFNPADTEFPVGYNPLAARTPEERPLVASAVIGVFKKLYGDSWGPRLEYFLRNAILALLETPNPSLLALPRLLTDKSFRKAVVAQLRDPLLRTFFTEEFEGYDVRWRAEALSPILNKVGQFLSAPLVRHIVGQSGPGFNLRELMDHGTIVIANLASGKIGEDNTALLGGLLVAGFQLAAMSRSDHAEEERRDFFLYVDEFQHFANDAFAGILSEARKYRLSLTLSHQYLDQLPRAISDAVLGNVGSLCAFRVGATDTTHLVRELAPAFDAQDLIHLPNYRFCARINRRGETVAPFSARTIPVSRSNSDVATLVKTSRRYWARLRSEVELGIADLWEGRDR